MKCELAAILLGCASAWAQTTSPGPAGTALDAIRGRAPTGEADDKVLDEWIAAEVRSLLEAPDPVRADAFRTAFKTQIADAKNAPEFTGRFAERTAQAFAKELADCAKLAAPAARAMAWVLTDFKRAGTVDGLEAGLKCADKPDVRFLCAGAFSALRDTIGPNAVLLERTLRILREAGQAETNGVVVAAIYDALQFTGSDRLAGGAEAMLDVLEARLQKRKAFPGGPVCDGGELRVLAFFQKNALPQALKERLVGRLAVMLRLDVERLAQAGAKPGEAVLSESEQAALAESLDLCEALLAQLVAPGNAPNVRGALKKAPDVRTPEMKLELNKWIGTEETPGILNETPWKVAKGAP